MRWTNRVDNRKDGDRRVVYKFLIFPKTINNETRWLEKAYIVQELQKTWDLATHAYTGLKWRDVKWDFDELNERRKL
jgi:hypothetical protein